MNAPGTWALAETKAQEPVVPAVCCYGEARSMIAASTWQGLDHVAASHAPLINAGSNHRMHPALVQLQNWFQARGAPQPAKKSVR